MVPLPLKPSKLSRVGFPPHELVTPDQRLLRPDNIELSSPAERSHTHSGLLTKLTLSDATLGVYSNDLLSSRLLDVLCTIENGHRVLLRSDLLQVPQGLEV